MLKPLLIGILLLGIVCPVVAQKSKTDSLVGAVRSQPDDTGKVNSLNLLSRRLYETAKYDSSLLVANQAIELGNKIGYNKGEGSGYTNAGNIYYLAAMFDSATYCQQKAIQLQTEAENPLGIGASNLGMGNIYMTQGNYPASMEHYLRARGIFEVLVKTDPLMRKHLGNVYNNMGNVNLLMKDYDSALVNYGKALELRLAMKDWAAAGVSYGSLGAAHGLLNNYDEALKNHREAIRLKQQVGDRQGVGSTYGNIGGIYVYLKQYDLALENFYASAAIADSLQDMETLANAYSNIGQVYVLQGKNDEAIEITNKALAIGEARSNLEILKNSHSVLYQADSALGLWKEANFHLNKHMEYSNQLLSEEKTREVVTAEMNYQFKREKEKSETEQAAQLEKEKLIKWFVAGGLVLLLLITLLAFNRQRLKQKTEHQLQLNTKQKEQADAVMETQESERKRIAEDLHDSLGHLLSTTKMHLQTLSAIDQPKVESSLHLLNQASEEIRNITFNLMPHTLEEGGLVPALHELAGKVSKAGVVKVNLQVHNMEKFTLEKQSQFNIYRIVQEAVNNILKHADAKEISLQLIGLEEHISIMIEDDGKGFDTTTKKTGRGLKNIVTRSLWLKGNINIDSQPGRGTTITTEIPV